MQLPASWPLVSDIDFRNLSKPPETKMEAAETMKEAQRTQQTPEATTAKVEASATT